MHVQNGNHYFYWKWDLYKPFDYEPVSIHTYSTGKTVLSRFHWHCATIWTEPLDEDDKPAVRFTKAIHTPVVKSKSYDYRYIEIEPTLPLKERIEIVSLYIPVFDKLLKGVSFKKSGKSYEEIMQDGRVPKQYLFEISKIKTAIVIGKFPKPEDLPETLKKKIWQD